MAQLVGQGKSAVKKRIYLSLRSPNTLVVLLFNIIVFAFAFQGIHSPGTDTFYHLAGGRYMFEHREILDREVFSFTILGRPWTNYYWLFECLLFLVFQLGGLTAVIALRAILVILSANLLLYLIYHLSRGNRFITLALGLLAFGLYIPRALIIRPHIFSYLFLILLVILLERFRKRERSFETWLPVLCILWANIHGVEYPIAIAVIGIYCISSFVSHLSALKAQSGLKRPVIYMMRQWTIMRWVLLFMLCTLAFLINPFGYKIFTTPLIAIDQEVMRHITEMRGYDFRSLMYLFPELNLFSHVSFNYAVLAGLIVLLPWVSRRNIRALLLFPLGLVLVLHKLRFMSEFAILVIPFIAEGFSCLRNGVASRRRAVDALLVVLSVYLLTSSLLTLRKSIYDGHYRQVISSRYPVGATQFLRLEGLKGNLFCDPTFAGYLTWSLYPDVRISMDMRTPEPFDARTAWIVRTAGRRVSFADLERQWPIDLILLEGESRRARKIAGDPDTEFALVYADQGYVLFAHERRLKDGLRHLRLRRLNPFDPIMSYIKEIKEPAHKDQLRSEAKRLLSTWPENHLAYWTLVMLMLSSDEYTDAKKMILELSERFPREATYRYFAGMAFKDMRLYEEAREQLKKALRLNPDFILPYPVLAETLYKLGQYSNGLKVMEEYLQRKDYMLKGEEYFLLGNLRYRVRDMVKAADAYERALWLIEESSDLRPLVENNLGAMYLELNKPERALQLLDAALRRKTPYPEAELNRAKAILRLGKSDVARGILKRLVEDKATPARVRSMAQEELSRLE